MDDQSWLGLLKQHKVIAVIRSPQDSLGLKMAQAVAAGGIRLIEITWNSQNPGHLITQLRSQLPDCTIGAGTILNSSQLDEAIASQAQFIFSPHTSPLLIQGAISAGIPMVPGALSPTEIVTAWQAGASSVKVFPSQAVGGANYIKSLQGPLGQIPLIPTGGITLNNACEFLAAGAIAVGLSSQLFPQELITAEDWQCITEKAKFLQEKLLINY